MVGNLLVQASRAEVTVCHPGPADDRRAASTHGERSSMIDGDDVVDLTSTDEWRTLVDHFEVVRHRHLRELFDEDPRRGDTMTVSAGDLTLDYSKHRVTSDTLR